MAERSFILRHRTAPGDITVMTALIRDIKAAYGDRFQVDVRTTFPEIWANNPYLTKLTEGAAGVEDYTLCYREGIRRAGRGEKIHFLTAFHASFHEFSKVRVPISAPKPDLHLAAHEISPLVSGRYWVILNGGKSDVTIKHWSYDGMQAVVSTLRGWGLRFVQIGGVYSGHIHINLSGALSLVGQTNLRDMMNIIYNAEGVICPVTCAMHMAAAFDKPCVVINGGREEPWWEGYTNAYQNFGEASGRVKVPHKFLHTVGTLDCCMTKGCWKKKVVKIDQDNELCYHPVYQPKGQTLPRCMQLITPSHVVEAVLSYYADGTLPPISQRKR